MPDTSFPVDRSVVITGAGNRSGIGWALAHHLVQDGWHVGVVDLPSSCVSELADEINQGSEVRAVAIELDVTDPDAVSAAFARTDRELPQLVGLVNLAGIASPEPIASMSVEHFRAVMDVNVTGSFLMLQAAVARMAANGVGRIVNTSSITALDGGGTFSKGGYAAAKAAVLGLTRGAAREFGAAGITANVVMPGPIDTEIMGGRLSDDRKSAMATGIPVGRVGTTDDVVQAVSFLLGEHAGFVNGATMQVDGGKYMH